MQYKNLKNIKAENQRNRQSERLKNDITVDSSTKCEFTESFC